MGTPPLVKRSELACRLQPEQDVRGSDARNSRFPDYISKDPYDWTLDIRLSVCVRNSEPSAREQPYGAFRLITGLWRGVDLVSAFAEFLLSHVNNSHRSGSGYTNLRRALRLPIDAIRRVLFRSLALYDALGFLIHSIHASKAVAWHPSLLRNINLPKVKYACIGSKLRDEAVLAELLFLVISLGISTLLQIEQFGVVHVCQIILPGLFLLSETLSEISRYDPAYSWSSVALPELCCPSQLYQDHLQLV